MRRTKQGFTLIELLIYVGVLASAGVFIVTQFSNVTSGSNLERAFTEIEKVRIAAQAYRAAPRRQGSYNAISMTQLSVQGYNVRPFTSGVAQNAYGKNITIAAAASGADATIVYQTGENQDCQQLLERYTNSIGVKTPLACATTNLTMTLE